MAMSDADKKESHRIACAKHYKKNQTALQRQSKLRMRRLRAHRKSEKAPQLAVSKETDIAQASHPELALKDSRVNALASEVGNSASVDMSILDDGEDDRLAAQDGNSASSEVSVDESQSRCSSLLESREHQERQSLIDGLTWAEAVAQKAKRTEEYLAEQTTLKDADQWYRNLCIQEGRPVELDDDNESLPIASDSEDI